MKIVGRVVGPIKLHPENIRLRISADMYYDWLFSLADVIFLKIIFWSILAFIGKLERKQDTWKEREVMMCNTGSQPESNGRCGYMTCTQTRTKSWERGFYCSTVYSVQHKIIAGWRKFHLDSAPTDCFLPTLFLDWLLLCVQIAQDLHCFMPEIIFNISKSLWSSKMQGIFWLFLGSMQNLSRKLCSSLFFSAYLFLSLCHNCSHRQTVSIYTLFATSVSYARQHIR